jgi:plastocyanin
MMIRASGAVPTGVMRDYQFVPVVLHVKSGSTVTLYNDDVIAHRIADDDPRGFAMSQDIKAGSSVSLKFGTVTSPFSWTFHCSIHPTMKGTIIVDPQ